MSAEGASQLSAGSDKPQPPKTAAGFSSFINKNTSGKKFAPKAARRRPGAATGASSTSSVIPASVAATPPVEPEATQPAGFTTPTVGSEIIQERNIPTPAATQENSLQDRSQAAQARVHAPILTIESPGTTTTENSEPSTAGQEAGKPSHQSEREDSTSHYIVRQSTGSHHAEEKLQLEPLSKQQSFLGEGNQPETSSLVLPSPSSQEVPGAPRQVRPVQQDSDAPIQWPSQDTTQTHQTGPSSMRATPIESISNTNAADVTNETTVIEPPAATQPYKTRTRSRLPWVAVNQLQGDEEQSIERAARTQVSADIRGKRIIRAEAAREDNGEDVEETDAATQPAANRRGKRRLRTEGHTDNEENTADMTGEGTEAAANSRTPTTRARGKRKIADTAREDVDASTVPTNRPRKPRKAKASKRHEPNKAMDEEREETVEEGQHSKKRRRKRVTKNDADAPGAIGNNAEGIDESVGSPQNRKGRRERAPTPSDAEDQEIDPSDTYMDNLASRNLRIGRLSERERKMREINWTEVRQRQREEDAMGINSPGNQAQVNAALDQAGEERNEAEQRQRGPQLREVNGQIELVEGSGNMDPQEDADREIEAMEIVEEADLTTRITSKSFLRNHKRNPQEFMLPGQGRRWTAEGTQHFYEALSIWGTDFAMIATMFPGTTRKSIKTKFTREERENPVRVKRALQRPGNEDADPSWKEYLSMSGRQTDSFVDPDEILRQLAIEEEKMRGEIEAAKLAREEENRQKKLAGVPVDDDEATGGGNKENGRKRKKKDKQAKTVTFQEEVGVEVIGNVSDQD